jgi:hypothetical protein
MTRFCKSEPDGRSPRQGLMDMHELSMVTNSPDAGYKARTPYVFQNLSRESKQCGLLLLRFVLLNRIMVVQMRWHNLQVQE